MIILTKKQFLLLIKIILKYRSAYVATRAFMRKMKNVKIFDYFYTDVDDFEDVNGESMGVFLQHVFDTLDIETT